MKFTFASIIALGLLSGEALAVTGTCIPSDLNPSTKCGSGFSGCPSGQKCTYPGGSGVPGFCIGSNVATNDGDCGDGKAGCPSGSKCQPPLN